MLPCTEYVIHLPCTKHEDCPNVTACIHANAGTSIPTYAMHAEKGSHLVECFTARLSDSSMPDAKARPCAAHKAARHCKAPTRAASAMPAPLPWASLLPKKPCSAATRAYIGRASPAVYRRTRLAQIRRRTCSKYTECASNSSPRHLGGPQDQLQNE